LRTLAFTAPPPDIFRRGLRFREWGDIPASAKYYDTTWILISTAEKSFNTLAGLYPAIDKYIIVWHSVKKMMSRLIERPARIKWR
jgi:hypothetical protein